MFEPVVESEMASGSAVLRMGTSACGLNNDLPAAEAAWREGLLGGELVIFKRREKSSSSAETMTWGSAPFRGGLAVVVGGATVEIVGRSRLDVILTNVNCCIISTDLQ